MDEEKRRSDVFLARSVDDYVKQSQVFVDYLPLHLVVSIDISTEQTVRVSSFSAISAEKQWMIIIETRARRRRHSDH